MRFLSGQYVLSDFKKLEKLGEGTYGVVYKALNLRTGETVAMKKIRCESQEEGIPSTSIREISLLREVIAHPNLVQLFQVIYTDPSRLFLIFEFVDMDLKKYLDSTDSMEPALIKSYMYQLIRAIEYCHSHRIVHRDLKPQNLLLDSEGIIKIADFGLARGLGFPIRAYTHEIVTLWYRAPELILGAARYGFSVDIWSLGCIFAEMALTQPIFHGDSEIDQLFKIFQILGTPDEDSWPAAKTYQNFNLIFPKWNELETLGDDLSLLATEGVDLFKKFLAYNPPYRMTAKAALEHPYFDDFDPGLLPPAPLPTVCDEHINGNI
ncbi:hypothetical protein HZS_100 [Henneguya salminicola]|nr:hypothetical protein HZS_100 [Henneguya salminicola]